MLCTFRVLTVQIREVNALFFLIFLFIETLKNVSALSVISPDCAGVALCCLTLRLG